MTREEILEKSRKENRGMDEREKEIHIQASAVSKAVGLTMTTILLVINMLTDCDIALNMLLYSLYFSITAAERLTLAFRLKKLHHWIVGILLACICIALLFCWWNLRS